MHVLEVAHAGRSPELGAQGRALACIAHKSLEICAPKDFGANRVEKDGLTAELFGFAETFRCFL